MVVFDLLNINKTIAILDLREMVIYTYFYQTKDVKEGTNLKHFSPQNMTSRSIVSNNKIQNYPSSRALLVVEENSPTKCF